MTRPRMLLPALVVAVGAISCAAIFFRLASEVHPLFASAVRLCCSALFFLPWGIWEWRRVELPEGFWRVACVAGLLYAVHFGTWVWSLQLTSVASSVTLVTITPLMLAAWGWWTGKDAPSRELTGAMVLACVGVAVLGWQDMQDGAMNWAGDLLAIAGAAAMGGYFVWVRPVARRIPLGLFSCVTCTVGGVALALASALIMEQWPDYELASWGWLIMASLIPQVIGHTLLTWALRHVTPTMAGVATLGEPVGATILGVCVLDESVSLGVWIGCAIILMGVTRAVRAIERRV